MISSLTLYLEVQFDFSFLGSPGLFVPGPRMHLSCINLPKRGEHTHACEENNKNKKNSRQLELTCWKENVYIH